MNIKKSKQVHTLTVNSKGVVLAGHRRRKACMTLGIDKVNVEVIDFDTPEEEIRFLVLNNKQRHKSNEQKAKEAKALKEVESRLAEMRLFTLGATGGRGNKKGVPNLAQGLETENKGKARDIVAKNVGLRSGHEVDRAIKAIDKIDELEECGVLNNGSVSAAEELAFTLVPIKIDLDFTGKNNSETDDIDCCVRCSTCDMVSPLMEEYTRSYGCIL